MDRQSAAQCGQELAHGRTPSVFSVSGLLRRHHLDAIVLIPPFLEFDSRCASAAAPIDDPADVIVLALRAPLPQISEQNVRMLARI
jgi:hypothetical protein